LRLRQEDGFTLTELVVVMPMLALVLAAITGTMVVLMNGNSKTTEQLTQQATVRPTLDAMMRDLRSTMPPSIGGYGVLSAGSTSLTFYSPDAIFATSGPTSAFHLREVAYRFSGGALQRQSVISTNTYTAVTSTIPWGSWTSASGSFPLAGYPTATGWTTLLGAGLTTTGSPPLVAASFTYYDGDGNLIAAPVSAANLGLIRTIQVNVTASSGGHAAQQTVYSNTATIRETQPSQ
jgi:prepilin-type N-terminal cleavage/methylation domain-containing protein